MKTCWRATTCTAYQSSVKLREKFKIYEIPITPISKCESPFLNPPFSQAPPTLPRSPQTPSRTAPAFPRYRTVPVKTSAPDHYRRQDRQTGYGPMGNTPGTISPSASSMPKSRPPTSTARLPPWSGLRTAPGIISRTTARHHDQRED